MITTISLRMMVIPMIIMVIIIMIMMIIMMIVTVIIIIIIITIKSILIVIMIVMIMTKTTMMVTVAMAMLVLLLSLLLLVVVVMMIMTTIPMTMATMTTLLLVLLLLLLMMMMMMIFPHKGQWRGALVFSLICVWINGWINNREAGDLIRHRAHYDVIVMTSYMNTWETSKNPRPRSGRIELCQSCTIWTMNFHMAYFSSIPQNNARLKPSWKFGESKYNPYWGVTLTTSHGPNYVFK